MTKKVQKKKNGSTPKPGNTPEDRKYQAHLEDVERDNKLMTHDEWIPVHLRETLTNSPAYQRRVQKRQKIEDDFLNDLVREFKIEDRKKLDQFLFDLNFALDCFYDHHEKGDDLIEISSLLEKITDTITDNRINSTRLGEISAEMVSKLEDYREACIDKHIPAKRNAPVAHEMDLLVSHAAGYLVNVLKIPFRYYKAEKEKKQPGKEFLKLVALHLQETRGLNIRGLNQAAMRHRKKLNEVKRKCTLKIKKKPIKS